MIGGLVILGIATLTTAYAVIVLRAAPTRRDNVAFGVLAFTDALMTGWRGLSAVAGTSLIDCDVTLPCSLGTVVLAVITIEFVAGFPRRAAMSWRWRLALWAWALAGMALALFVDGPTAVTHGLSEPLFFGPVTLTIAGLGVRAWRTTTDRAARTVIGLLIFRWTFGFATYSLAPALGFFEPAVWAEATVATLASTVVIGTVVLRSELFSLRCVAAEVVTIGAMAFVVLLGGGAAVAAILRWTTPGALHTVLLVGATLVPLALAAGLRAVYPRVERGVLAGLDERRARRLGMQDEPLPTDEAGAIAEATRRVAAIGDGARVAWTPASALPPGLAASLRDALPHRRAEEPALPGALVVPALGADGALVGAFYVDGGTIDRDTYIVARDLAARVALAVERATAVRALEEARQLAALGQFAAAIAHDIRTPLTSISLNVQILRRKLALAPDDAEHLDIALEELGRLDRSVAEILDFAKPVRLARTAIDVRALLEDAARGLTPVWADRGVALRCEDVAAALPEIEGDALRLRQVVVNLVDNAAEASPRGAEVTLRAARAGDGAVHIDVCDRGRGIGPDDLAHIFEPFFTTRADGTGLGLAICHKLVAAHGGELRVRSAPGEGSTFTIVLPAALPA